MKRNPYPLPKVGDEIVLGTNFGFSSGEFRTISHVNTVANEVRFYEGGFNWHWHSELYDSIVVTKLYRLLKEVNETES